MTGGYQPDRYAVAPEAACNFQAAMRATKDDGALSRRPGGRVGSAHLEGDGSAVTPPKPRRPCAGLAEDFPAIRAARRR